MGAPEPALTSEERLAALEAEIAALRAEHGKDRVRVNELEHQMNQLSAFAARLAGILAPPAEPAPETATVIRGRFPKAASG